MSNNETSRAIERIKTVTVEDKVKSATISLINLIPYAGGVVASLITDYASQQKVSKICDVLSDLNDRLETQHADPEKHLNKDQVVEVVHQTLAHAALSSDKAKIHFLKNGLAYSFIEADRFEAKQVFLDTLRSCTALELAVMNIIYESSDPYVIYEGKPVNEPTNFFTVVPMFANGKWEVQENRSCDHPQLAEYLARNVGFDAFLIRGVAHMLDGRGLTNMVPRLAESQCKVMKWVDFQTMQVTIPIQVTILPTQEKQIQPTPIEASQTDFGRNFMRFCNYS